MRATLALKGLILVSIPKYVDNAFKKHLKIRYFKANFVFELSFFLWILL